MLHSTNGGDIEPTKLQCNVGSLSYSEGVFKAKLPSNLRVNYALNCDLQMLNQKEMRWNCDD